MAQRTSAVSAFGSFALSSFSVYQKSVKQEHPKPGCQRYQASML